MTTAERLLTSKDIPGLLPEFEGKTLSLCFRAPKAEHAMSMDASRTGSANTDPRTSGTS